MVPQVYSCFLQLQSDHNCKAYSTKISSNYNLFLKTNFDITSHQLRKFLPNLQSLTDDFENNTAIGHWSSKSVMNSHYVQNSVKFVTLYKLIKRLRGSNGSFRKNFEN